MPRVIIADFKKGATWAYRRSRRLGEPAAKVRLLALVERGRSKQIKVQHVEGELGGLEEFVRPTTLVCRWSDWPKLARDESRELALAEVAGKNAPDTVVQEAASEVFGGTGEDIYLDAIRGYTFTDPKSLERVAERAGFSDRPWRRAPCFTDRRGDRVVLNAGLVDLAIAFAAAEPETVTMAIDELEEKYRAQGYVPGERHMHRLLLEYKPAWALARQWAGKGAEHENLRREVERLRGLVERGAMELRSANREREANRLLRALRGL